MNSEPGSTWLILPAILLILGGLMAAGVYLFITYWKTAALTTTRQVQGQMRRLREKTRQLRALLQQSYSREDPEPFGSHVSELYRQLEGYEAQVKSLYTRYAGAQQEVTRASSRRWQSILLLPLNWYRAQRASVRLKDEAETTTLTLEEIENHFNDLEKLGWEVANAARDAVAKLQEVDFLVEQLAQQNLRGGGFDAVLAHHADLREAFSTIPGYFRTALEADFLATVDKGEVVQVYQLLQEKQPGLDGLLRQVKAWIEQSAKASDNLLVLLKSVERIRGMLSHAPEELNFSEMQQRASQLSASVNDVDARLTVPAADELPAIARETSQMVRITRDMEQQYQAALDHLAGFKKMLAELTAEVSLLATRYVKYEKMPFYPLVWDISRPLLGEIRRQTRAMGAQVEPRSPAQMKDSYQSALLLSRQIEELQHGCQQMEKQHADLVAIMQMLAVPAGLEWCRGARVVLEQAREYHPDNWSRKSDLDLLPDIERIEETFQHKLPQNPLVPVKESELAQKLGEAFQISDLYKVLQNQVKELQRRQADLQTQERGARENLATVLEVVNQVGFSTEHNRALETIVTSETEALQRNVEQLTAELGKRSQGSLEKKVKKVRSFIDGFERISSGWLSQLLADTEALQDDIAATLRDLSAAYPRLDEPAINEAQASLAGALAPSTQPTSQGEQTGSGKGLPRKNAPLPLSEAAAGFRRVDEAWQRAAAARENLRQAAAPVLEAFLVMEEQRREVKLQLDRSASWIGGGSGRGQQLARLAQEYDAQEKERDIARDRISAAAPAAQNLERFAERYKILAERVRGLADQAETEQRRIDQLKHEIDQSINLWSQQQRRYAGSFETRREIEALIDEVERNQAHLDEQHQGGSISYPQYMQGLISFSKRLNNATVTVDGEQRIDINGANS